MMFSSCIVILSLNAFKRAGMLPEFEYLKIILFSLTRLCFNAELISDSFVYGF